jgi:hypothetical protein
MDCEQNNTVGILKIKTNNIWVNSARFEPESFISNLI